MGWKSATCQLFNSLIRVIYLPLEVIIYFFFTFSKGFKVYRCFVIFPSSS